MDGASGLSALSVVASSPPSRRGFFTALEGLATLNILTSSDWGDIYIYICKRLQNTRRVFNYERYTRHSERAAAWARYGFAQGRRR